MKKLFSTFLFVFLAAALLVIPAAASSSPVPADKPLLDEVITNDNNQVVTYSGTWTHELASGYFSGDYHLSSTTDDYVQYTFVGQYMALVAATGPDRGKADVYFDNVLDTTIDLYSPTVELLQTVWELGPFTLGAHTVKVVVRGDSNESSAGVAIDIDAFKYNDGMIGNSLPPGSNEIQLNSAVIGSQGLGIGTGSSNYECNPSVGSSTNTQVVCTANISSYDPGYPQNGKVFLNVGLSSSLGNLTIYYQIDVAITDGSSPVYGLDAGSISSSGTYILTGSHTFQGGIYADDSYQGNITGTVIMTFSTTPFEPECAKRYANLTTAGPFVIDPTIEDPKGPDAVSPDAPDEQIYTDITVGETYAIRLAGGPWNDGTTNKDDVSYSWDGETWLPLKNAPCVIYVTGQPYYLTSYIQAESTTLYIAVSDTRDQTPSAFANNTTPGSDLLYYVSTLITLGDLTCDDQFTFDRTVDFITSVTVPADEPYTQVDWPPVIGQLVAGDWYVIESASGSWKDDGTGPDRYDSQFTFQDPTQILVPPVFYDLAEGSKYIYCVEAEQNNIVAFVQAEGPDLWLRVRDLEETFSENTGSLGFNIYHATFSRRAEDCELRYQVQGLVSDAPHGTIDAKWENGYQFGYSLNSQTMVGAYLEPGGIYMLETTGGPWGYIGTSYDTSYGLAISDDGGETWTSLSEWADSVCNVQIDALGHRRIFFQVPESPAKYYRLRVDDTSNWIFNIRDMGYNLYKAYDLGVTPTGSCDYSFDADHPVSNYWVDARVATGTEIGALGVGLASNTLYAIKIIGDDTHLGNVAYWAETTGGTHRWDLEIYDGGRDNYGYMVWKDFPDSYGGTVCYFSDGNTITAFIYTGDHHDFRLRVNSTTFNDNTGQVFYYVYNANAGDTINPWVTCTNSLSLTSIASEEWLDPTRPDGERIPLGSGNLNPEDPVIGYVVAVTSGVWGKGEDAGESETTWDNYQHFDVALSADNGQTWAPTDRTNSDIVCSKQDLSGQYTSTYFKVEDGQVWKIRVNDDDAANWANNTGGLRYKVYAVTEGPIISDLGNSSIDVCGLALIRPVPPDNLLDVPSWLSFVADTEEYIAKTILQFIAWCPRHTQALMGLLNIFRDKEPMATLDEIQGVTDEVKQQMDAYNWNDTTAQQSGLVSGSGGGVTDNIWNQLFPRGSSPWNGGPVIRRVTWSGNSYYNACVSDYSEILQNENLTVGVCFVSAAAKEVGASFVLQIMLELAAIGFIFWDLIRQVQALASFMAKGGFKIFG